MADVVARITNSGAKAVCEQYTLGRFFKVDKFTVGAGTVGCDPTTFLPLVPDLTVSAWPDQTTDIPFDLFPGSAPYTLGSRVTVFPVTVPDQFKNRQISSVGLYGTYVYTENADDLGLIGTVFLHSIANFGLITVPSDKSTIVTLKLYTY